MDTGSRTLAVLVSLSLSVAIGASQSITLANHGLSVEFDAAAGTATKIANLITGEVHNLKGRSFEVETDAGAIAVNGITAVRQENQAVEFDHTSGSLRFAVRYEAPAGTDYLLKTIRIANTGSAAVVLRRIAPLELQFSPALEQIHPHNDPSQFQWLINVFLRGREGGFYLGIENPIFEHWTKGSTPGSTWIQLAYSPNIVLAPGETYTSDAAFLGSFRKERVYLFKELGKLRQAVNAPKAIPSALNFDQEILDWGEVWAMQDFVRSRQPAHDPQHAGFYVRVVAMVGGTKTGELGEQGGFHIPFGPGHVQGSKRFTDEIVALGHIPHIEWATEWFGLGGYANSTEDFVLENATGLEVPANPHWLEVVKYGWSKGIETGIFETATRNFARPKNEWKVALQDGKPWTYGKSIPMNCWANRDYAQWRLDVTDKAVRDYRLYMVAYDAIVPADWSWIGWPVIQTQCYAKNHGHLPGDIRYPVFRNILWFLDELQRRNPKLALRAASGLTTAYPWILKNLIEYHPNFYDGETGATYWTSYNFRFLPLYKSGLLLSAKSKAEFEWLLLRSISLSDHFMLWPDAVPVALENKEFWTKWLTWADRNIEYLRVGRTLFREPWGDEVVSALPPALEGRLPSNTSAIHGSAHVIRDKGFLFLFNPSAAARVAALPISHWIGLTEGDQFQVRVQYPEPAREYGPYKRGEELHIELAARSAMVLEVTPSAGAGPAARPQVSSTASVDRAFLTWDQIPWSEIEAAP